MIIVVLCLVILEIFSGYCFFFFYFDNFDNYDNLLKEWLLWLFICDNQYILINILNLYVFLLKVIVVIKVIGGGLYWIIIVNYLKIMYYLIDDESYWCGY